MLTNNEIRTIAINYLLSKGYPLEEKSCRIVLPHEEENPNSRDFLIKYNIACVSFASNFDPSLPNQDLLPDLFVLYVNVSTGEVSMQRHF